MPRVSPVSSIEKPLQKTREARKVAIASFLGTTVEYYDFVVYGAAAALIFGPQFFPADNPVVSQLGAFATFAVGFLTRPLGGAIAGHFGDRIGRKRILVVSLVLMGTATVLVGLLPTYKQIGMAAPLLLVILRLLQGLAVGAEWGGAALMAVEHAPPKWRILYGSSPQLGVPAGSLLASVMMLVLSSATGDSFTDWGWRIAFLASIVLVVFGLVIRRTLTESPLFEQAEKRRPARVPLIKVLRHYPGGVLVGIFSNAAPAALGYTVLAFVPSYGTEAGYTRNELLTAVILASVFWFIAMPLMAAVADRWGRRKTMLIGTWAQLCATLVFFPLFDTGILVAAVLACGLAVVTNAAQYAPLPTMLSDLFPTNLRYSGSSFGYQLGAILGGSLAPIIATTIYAGTGSSILIGVYLAGMTVLAMVAILFAHTSALTAKVDEAERELLKP